MKIYFTCRFMPIFTLMLLLLAAVFLGAVSQENTQTVLCNNEYERAELLKSLGVEQPTEPALSKDIKIPEQFGDVYTQYNKLQYKAGFDLNDYRGKTATVYSYPFKNAFVNLIVYDGKLIGGDVCNVNIGGEMLPLLKESINYFDTT